MPQIGIKKKKKLSQPPAYDLNYAIFPSSFTIMTSINVSWIFLFL